MTIAEISPDEDETITDEERHDVVAETPAPDTTETSPADSRTAPARPARRATSPRPTARRRAVVVLLSVVAVVLSFFVVLTALEPMFQYREQERLFEDIQRRVENATNEASGLAGVEVPTEPEAFGAPTAILEIGALQLQQVVLEGASAENLQVGPGHVRGTSGIGQPGNAVIVGRRTTFGSPFGDLAALQPGTPILLTTAQGESLYKVRSVETRPVTDKDLDVGDGTKQLTLVTSAGGAPWNGTDGVVVIADLEGLPLAPTPQGARYDGGTGRTLDGSAALLGVLFAGALVAAVLIGARLNRSRGSMVAYVLVAAPILALTILMAESFSRVLPGWW